MRDKLTDVAIRARIKSGETGLLGDGAGLYLRTSKGGSASWIYRYWTGHRGAKGAAHDMGLGPYPLISLAEARRRRDEHARRRLDGTDPIQAKRSQKLAAKIEAATAMTFRECAEKYIATHSAGWRNPKHAKQWPATLGAYVYPVFGSLPVQAIDVGLVMKAIEPIWNGRTETASRVRGRIEAILDWATSREYRRGDNPARWKGHLENLLPKKNKVARVKHHAALPYTEIGSFMAELRQQEGIAARALEFTILASARTGEVIGARWSEIDLEARLWTVPANRMKAGKEHRVPLSDAALAILEALPRAGDYVFAGARPGRPLNQAAMTTLLHRMHRGALTVHGFRSSFADWSAELTNFPSEVREMALAHVVGDKVEAAYRRGDLFEKRRQLADAWSRHCTGATTDNVIELSASARA
jgi:integrase